ncbi:hypothetical protein CDD81_3343 [Ophiocordyceps australis]|uniref:Vacuolar protein sorting-associated protein 51 homolog n=1 Tax=Ophiocordyceps australis TaxID=1399860 RepID=A0A2C5XWM1_9HYPO|nr:hypothetical protein CDD81_3343 [Ophiocordyceps australis]
MSTIATPRDRPGPPSRHQSGTPTSSSRASFDADGASLASPGPGPPLHASQHASPHALPSKRANRAALREYYKLRAPPPPRIEMPLDSEVPPSELDAPHFNVAAYVDSVVGGHGLADLLRLYSRIVAEMRALDAEKKALVYDNYSKLIAATDTIRKMRANMDPLNPMASTLDAAISHIYNQAAAIRDAARDTLPLPDSQDARTRALEARRRKTRQLAVLALAMPQRLRDLIAEGQADEASRQWNLVRRLLMSWKHRGLGGPDVDECINQGDAALSRTAREPES